MGAGLFIGKGGEHVKATCLSLLGVFKVRRGALRIRRGSDSAEELVAETSSSESFLLPKGMDLTKFRSLGIGELLG